MNDIDKLNYDNIMNINVYYNRLISQKRGHRNYIPKNNKLISDYDKISNLNDKIEYIKTQYCIVIQNSIDIRDANQLIDDYNKYIDALSEYGYYKPINSNKILDQIFISIIDELDTIATIIPYKHSMYNHSYPLVGQNCIGYNALVDKFKKSFDYIIPSESLDYVKKVYRKYIKLYKHNKKIYENLVYNNNAFIIKADKLLCMYDRDKLRDGYIHIHRKKKLDKPVVIYIK